MFNFATVNVYIRFPNIVFFPIGVNIMKFVFFVFNESLLVLNHIENLCS